MTNSRRFNPVPRPLGRCRLFLALLAALALPLAGYPADSNKSDTGRFMNSGTQSENGNFDHSDSYMLQNLNSSNVKPYAEMTEVEKKAFIHMLSNISEAEYHAKSPSDRLAMARNLETSGRETLDEVKRLRLEIIEHARNNTDLGKTQEQITSVVNEIIRLQKKSWEKAARESKKRKLVIEEKFKLAQKYSAEEIKKSSIVNYGSSERLTTAMRIVEDLNTIDRIIENTIDGGIIKALSSLPKEMV